MVRLRTGHANGYGWNAIIIKEKQTFTSPLQQQRFHVTNAGLNAADRSHDSSNGTTSKVRRLANIAIAVWGATERERRY